MTKRPREWLAFGGLLAVTALVGAAFLGFADRRPANEIVPASTPAVQQAALTALTQNRPAPLSPSVQPAVDLSEAFTAVVEVVRPGVVFIEAEQRGVSRPRTGVPFFPQQPGPQIRQGTGSGFIISEDGYILTNNHVVEGAARITVRLFDRREFPAEVVGTDPATDVAVLRIGATQLPALALGDSDPVQVGAWVLAVGNPLGQAFSFTVTAGIVSGKGRFLAGLPVRSDYAIMDFIQTDAAINPGNSGGPLVNLAGQVIGINSAIASETGFYQGYGFAIPINLVRRVADQLIRDGHVTRAILGVSIRDAGPEDAEYVGLSEIRGVVVQDYSSAGSPAQEAGIRQGDVIISLNGEPVHYVAQLQQTVGFMHPGEQVRVEVAREGGERRTYRVRLAAAPTNRDAPVQTASAEGPKPGTAADTQPHTTRLGIGVRPIDGTATVRNQPLGEDHAGLAVMSVDIDSPARDPLLDAREQGGPDIITHVNGTRVQTVDQFNAALDRATSGQIVSLRVWNQTLGRFRTERIRVP